MNEIILDSFFEHTHRFEEIIGELVPTRGLHGMDTVSMDRAFGWGAYIETVACSFDDKTAAAVDCRLSASRVLRWQERRRVCSNVSASINSHRSDITQPRQHACGCSCGASQHGSAQAVEFSVKALPVLFDMLLGPHNSQLRKHLWLHRRRRRSTSDSDFGPCSGDIKSKTATSAVAGDGGRSSASSSASSLTVGVMKRARRVLLRAILQSPALSTHPQLEAVCSWCADAYSRICRGDTEGDTGSFPTCSGAQNLAGRDDAAASSGATGAEARTGGGGRDASTDWAGLLSTDLLFPSPSCAVTASGRTSARHKRRRHGISSKNLLKEHSASSIGTSQTSATAVPPLTSSSWYRGRYLATLEDMADDDDEAARVTNDADAGGGAASGGGHGGGGVLPTPPATVVFFGGRLPAGGGGGSGRRRAGLLRHSSSPSETRAGCLSSFEAVSACITSHPQPHHPSHAKPRPSSSSSSLSCAPILPSSSSSSTSSSAPTIGSARESFGNRQNKVVEEYDPTLRGVATCAELCFVVDSVLAPLARADAEAQSHSAAPPSPDRQARRRFPAASPPQPSEAPATAAATATAATTTLPLQPLPWALRVELWRSVHRAATVLLLLLAAFRSDGTWAAARALHRESGNEFQIPLPVSGEYGDDLENDSEDETSNWSHQVIDYDDDDDQGEKKDSLGRNTAAPAPVTKRAGEETAGVEDAEVAPRRNKRRRGTKRMRRSLKNEKDKKTKRRRPRLCPCEVQLLATTTARLLGLLSIPRGDSSSSNGDGSDGGGCRGVGEEADEHGLSAEALAVPRDVCRCLLSLDGFSHHPESSPQSLAPPPPPPPSPPLTPLLLWQRVPRAVLEAAAVHHPAALGVPLAAHLAAASSDACDDVCCKRAAASRTTAAPAAGAGGAAFNPSRVSTTPSASLGRAASVPLSRHLLWSVRLGECRAADENLFDLADRWRGLVAGAEESVPVLPQPPPMPRLDLEKGSKCGSSWVRPEEPPESASNMGSEDETKQAHFSSFLRTLLAADVSSRPRDVATERQGLQQCMAQLLATANQQRNTHHLFE